MSAQPDPLGRLRRDDRGSIAVEFALIAPILMLILAGVIDLGRAGAVKLSLNARVTAAADYALLGRPPADQAAARAMAETILSLLDGQASQTASVVVNNAARADWTGTRTTSVALSGTGAQCYCPTLADGAVSWGKPLDCGTACQSGDSAGQFIQISAAARHSTIFPGYVFLDGDMVRTHAMLRLQ